MKEAAPTKLVPIAVDDECAEALRRGRVWVYREAMMAPLRAPVGALIDVRDRKGQSVGLGLYDPDAAIAVRVISKPIRERVPFDLGALVRRRLEEARGLRERVLDLPSLDAYRLANAEGDGLSGLAVDVYGEFAVLELTSPAWGPHRAAIVDAIDAVGAAGGVRFRGILEKSRLRPGAGGEVTEQLRGEKPPELLVVREGPARYGVELDGTAKSGLFLDQRETRESLRRLARGATTALNGFCFTGSLSVALAQGGAGHVVSVDLSRPALQRAQRNFELNELRPERHEIVEADAFETLTAFADGKRRFDLVVLDPPAFAQSKKQDARRRTFQAERDYAELATLGARLLTARGLLVASTPMAALPMQSFERALSEGAARAGVTLSLFDARSQPADHPVDPACPEKRYLKVLFAARRG